MRKFQVLWSLLLLLLAGMIIGVQSTNSPGEEETNRLLSFNNANTTSGSTFEYQPWHLSSNLNCSSQNHSFCSQKICKDAESLQFSATFCDVVSGSCVCDCRDVLDKSCLKTPFTPCFTDCVRRNPNPEVYLYEGALCPAGGGSRSQDQQCACECSFREDYEETNDI